MLKKVDQHCTWLRSDPYLLADHLYTKQIFSSLVTHRLSTELLTKVSL